MTEPGRAGGPIRVLIVDDHPVVRPGMRTLLAASPAVGIVGEAGDGEEALSLVGSTLPDVVLSDLPLGAGLDGIGVARAVRASHLDVAVLILTTFDHGTDIVRAVEAAVAGYLLKDAAAAEIVGAIRSAAVAVARKRGLLD